MYCIDACFCICLYVYTVMSHLYLYCHVYIYISSYIPIYILSRQDPCEKCLNSVMVDGFMVLYWLFN